MARARRSTQQRREQITHAASLILLQGGIAAFSMEKIAKSVGITPQSLYRHFTNRQEIIETAILHLHEERIRFIDALREKTDSPCGQLRLFLLRQIAWANAGNPPLIAVQPEKFDGYDKLYDKVRKLYDSKGFSTGFENVFLNRELEERMRTLKTIIEKAQEQNEIRTDVSVVDIATTLFYLTTGAITLLRFAETATVKGITLRAWFHYLQTVVSEEFRPVLDTMRADYHLCPTELDIPASEDGQTEEDKIMEPTIMQDQLRFS